MNRTKMFIFTISPNCVIFLLLLPFFLVCTTIGPQKEWNNPIDQEPVTTIVRCKPTIDSVVFSGTTEIGNTLYLKIHAQCSDDSLFTFLWSFDGGASFDTTSDSTYQREWSLDDTGSVYMVAGVENSAGSLSVMYDTTFILGAAYPRINYPIRDTIVTQYAEIQKALTATDADGVIQQYYWSTEESGWSDSTGALAGPIITLENPSGGPLTVRWAVVDNDGLMAFDTFTVVFNRGPDSLDFLSPEPGKEAFFKEYDLSADKGNVWCTFRAHDPDSVDTLSFRLTLTGSNSDTIFTYSGTDDSVLVENLSTSMTITWWLQVKDAFGDSISSFGSFITQRPPAMPEGMILIAGGSPKSFRMGQTGFSDAEEPIHTVVFTQGYFIDSTEVTTIEYATVMGMAFDSTRALFPATEVTWYDAVLYCNEKSKDAGYDTIYTYSDMEKENSNVVSLVDISIDYNKTGFRLPTEAEWEYACKIDSLSLFFWGNDNSQAGAFCWTRENSGGKMHKVATRQPSGMKLYDMSGNVWEWCNDWFDAEYYKSSPSVDPRGPDTGDQRIVRGGSYLHSLFFAQAGTRSMLDPAKIEKTVGFRTVIKTR